MKYTKKAAREAIEQYKENTAYFDNEMSIDDMRFMLRQRMEFGEAETEIIIASLVIAGAKFKSE